MEEKKYKDLLERLYKAKYDNNVCDERYCCVIDDIVPELKESEGERIRKEILDYIDKATGCKRWIDWLEKQGEQKETLCDKCRKEQPSHSCQDITELGRCAVEREQKPADKVEPKFKKGDWITNGDYTWKIVEVKPLDYVLQSQDGNIVDDTISHVDKQFHSFTIEDAKDGDVLAYATDEGALWIMIYWSLYEPYEGHVHYHALLVNNNFSDKGTCCICIDNLKPATKEQRDTLMKATNNAGFTFDFEKKELKKIEQKSATMSLDEAIEHCKEKSCGNNACALEHKQLEKWLTELKELKEQNPVWSEEDEERVKETLAIIGTVEDINKAKDGFLGAKMWLKSLKERVQPQNTWKPSDEQMRELGVVATGKGFFRKEILSGLLEQLKKLREE